MPRRRPVEQHSNGGQAESELHHPCDRLPAREPRCFQIPNEHRKIAIRHSPPPFPMLTERTPRVPGVRRRLRPFVRLYVEDRD